MTLLSISALSVLQNGKTATAASATIFVPANVGTIQEAINLANSGDTIAVAAGTYKENVIINKNLTLVGDGQDVTFIVASTTNDAVVTITANEVKMSGFTIKNGFQGMYIQSSNMSVVSNNTFTSNIAEGVYIYSSHGNALINNTISLNGFEGIFVLNSIDTLIKGNVVTNNQNVGIDLFDSNNTRISNNTITFHQSASASLHKQGIWAVSSNNNTIDGNTILKNDWGIDAYISVNNTVYGNIIANNFHGVDLDPDSTDNTFYHNNFDNNTYQANAYLSTNRWDNGTQGNYWSDYTGTDGNGDGIGDTPYVIDQNNQDRYPLMNRWRPPGIDTTPPVTTDNYDGLWHNQTFAITLTAEDFSGIKETYYIINPPVWITNNVSANGQPLITQENANNTLEYWSVDNAVPANEERPHKILTGIKLDKTVPYGSININSGDSNATSTAVTLNLFGNDTISGISQMRFSDNNISWIPWETYATTKTWYLSGNDGVKTVYVQYMDNAGLSSQAYVDTIILDTTAPTVSILSPTNGAEIKSADVTIQWSGTDAGVGIEHYEIRLDNGSWTNVAMEQSHTFNGTTEGNHAVYIKAVDKVGHSREVSVNFVVNTKSFPYIELIVVVLVVLAIGTLAGTLYIRRNRKRSAGFEAKKSERKDTSTPRST
jgi:parallel beta-helix repeat protein